MKRHALCITLLAALAATRETEQQQGRTQGKTQFKAETANPANSSR